MIGAVTILVSPLMPTGQAALKRGNDVVAFGAVADIVPAYQPGMVLVISEDLDESIRAELARDVMPRPAIAQGTGS